MKIFSRTANLKSVLAASAIISFLLISPLVVVTTGSSSYVAAYHDNAVGKHVARIAEKPSNAFSPVDPYSLYGSEPAPIGVADYGIGPNNSPYSYNTTSFLGIIKIGSLSVVNNSTSSDSLSFQLNINLEFTVSGVTYVYWAQDVSFLNTTTNSVSFIDNIWNMSSARASMHNSTVSGNGVVSTSGSTKFYYDVADSNLSGALSNLINPSTIELKVNSMVNSKGFPELSFQYRDGFGWQTYDNVNFTFASSLTADHGFLVSGYGYEPNNYTFYDAELILGGPGGGAATTDLSSNLSLELQYWNGNNYQEIPNAFNFGSNTAESISNAISGAYYHATNGSLFEKITNGPGSLAQVYNSNTVSSLAIVAPINGGTLSINGSITPFKGNRINMTLAPGNYSISLYSGAFLYYKSNVTISAGQDLLLHLNEYLVKFNESGLPYGSRWWVNLSQSSYSSSSGSIEFYLSNGSYHFNVSGPNGNYKPNITAGTFEVAGTEVTVEVGFSPALYNVTFKEFGPPAGTKWSILLNNATYSSENDTLTIQVTNGSYNFIVVNLTDYYTLNYTYSLTVSGKNLSEDVLFHQYAIIRGAISPSGASISINGIPVQVANGKFNFSAIAGNYTILVSSPGFYTYTKNVTLTSGQNITLSINLTMIPQPESKLPGYEALGALAAALAVIGVGAALVRRR